MGLIDSLIKNAGYAIPGAAAARGGYLTGQEEEKDKQRLEKRQSILDQITAAREGAYANEANARAESLRNPIDDQPVFSQDGTPYTYSKRKGTLTKTPIEGANGANSSSSGSSTAGQSLLGRIQPQSRLADDAGADNDPQTGFGNADAQDTPETPNAPSPKFGPRAPIPRSALLKQPNVVNPQTGMVEDVYNDGTRKTIRKATAAEMTNATTPHRDPNAPPPKDPVAEKRLVLQTRLGNLKTQIDQNAKDVENRTIADDTTGLGGLRQRGDSLRGVADNVNTEVANLDAATPGPKGLLTTIKPKGSVAPVSTGGGMASLRSGQSPEAPSETVPQAALDPSKDEIVMEAYKRIRAGVGTFDQAAQALSPARAAALKKLLARQQ